MRSLRIIRRHALRKLRDGVESNDQQIIELYLSPEPPRFQDADLLSTPITVPDTPPDLKVPPKAGLI